MSPCGSVTVWIERLKAGDSAAAEQIWERYFRRLVELARRRLQGAPRAAADEEDVALSAFDNFCRSVEAGRFPRLDDREDLWQLLVVLTDRKACDLANRERRQRRGGGKVRDEAALGEGDSAGPPLTQLASPEPGPEFVARAADECRRLLELLGDDDLRRAALRKLERYSVEEIAAECGRVPRTVKRWLRLIRQTWEQELPP